MQVEVSKKQTHWQFDHVLLASKTVKNSLCEKLWKLSTFKPPRLSYFIKAGLKCNTNCKSLSLWSWHFQGWSWNLCCRKFCLGSPLAVLWCHVFYLTLGAMLSFCVCVWCESVIWFHGFTWGCPATREECRNNSRKNEEKEPKRKQSLVVNVTGDGSKVRCCKEQYYIGTWNVRSMNQGTLEVVK